MATFKISERYFTIEEIQEFQDKHGFSVTEIEYESSNGEIDFSVKDEKEFLLENGYPKILARFFA